VRRSPIVLLTLTLGAALVLGVPGSAQADPPNDFGNSCTAVAGPTNVTAVMTSKGAGNPLPITAPSTGVITKARFAFPAFPGTVPMIVKVLRSAGAANQFTVVAQSEPVNVSTGVNTLPVRVPVTAGDLLGMGGIGAAYCTTGDPTDVVALATGDVAPGGTATFTAVTSAGLSLVATIEPDADHDSYGDTTQDLCPQSATTHAACPTIKLASLASASGNRINVLVAAASPAKVSVSGLAKVNGKKVTLKGGSHTVEPGSLTTFKVKLPKALKSALAKLPASKKITVTLTSSATDVAGRVTTDTTKVKLPGTK
jgi:hypothetical protein